MADIELEVLSRAVMTGGIDKLIAAGIEERHFFDPAARAVFNTCVAHYAVWRNPLSLDGVKRHHPDFQLVPATDELGYLVREFSIDRGIKTGLSAVLDMHLLLEQAESGDRDARVNFIDRFMEIARRVAAESPGEPISRFSDMTDRIETIRRQQELGEMPGVPTGIEALDKYVRAISPGEFYVHTGFSGRGKTQSLTRSSVPAYLAGDVVVMNSLEMSKEEIWEIYDAEAARLSRRAIRHRELDDGDYERYAEAAARVRAAPNDIIYVRVETVDKLAAMVERYGAGTVCVDYVSLMEGQRRSSQDWERVKDVSQSLKKMAGDMGVKVYAAAQNSKDAALNGPTEDNIAYSCVPLNTQILTKRGWLSHDKVQAGDYTIGFDPVAQLSRWTEVKRVFHYKSAPVVRFGHSRWDAVCTPNHRWVGDQMYYVVKDGVRDANPRSRSVFLTSEDVNGRSRIRLAAPCELPAGAVSTQDAAIVAWLWTDGTLRMSTKVGLQNKRPKVEGLIYQKKPHGIDEVRRVLDGVPYTESVDSRGKITFRIAARWLRELIDRCGLRELSPVDFVLGLGNESLSAFLDACWHAEGWRTGKDGNLRAMAQNEGPMLDAMCLAVYLSGFRPGLSSNGGRCKNVSFSNPFVHGQWLQSDPAGDEPVWCVETELGSWTMRQNGGSPMLTGNSAIFYDCNVMVGWHQTGEWARIGKMQGRLIKNRGGDKGPPGDSGYYEFYERWDRDRMIMEPWTPAMDFAAKLATS
jgi:replicative DNA helicase